MRGRVYDPRTTRFNSPDPIGQPWSEGVNRFSYVRNSPVLRIDPSGYEDESPFDLKPGEVKIGEDGMVRMHICLSCEDESTPKQPKPVSAPTSPPTSDTSSSASGPTTASDVADRWDTDARARTYGIFADSIDPSAPLHEHVAYAATVLSIELGAGFVDALRLGKGAAEGTLKGLVSDGFRALSIVGTVKSVAGPLATRSTVVKPVPTSVGCFAAGTLVATPAGATPIEALSIDQSVCSINNSGTSSEDQTIVGIETLRYHGAMLALQMDDASTVSVTPNHAFCVVAGVDLQSRRWPLDIGSDSPLCNYGEGRWVEAGDLRTGDSLPSASGTRVIRNVSAASFEGDVYNIAVSRSHTYLVGPSGLLVHNKAALSPVGVARAIAAGLDRALCKYGKCFDFADRLEQALARQGVSYQRIIVRPANGTLVYSSKGLRPNYAIA